MQADQEHDLQVREQLGPGQPEAGAHVRHPRAVPLGDPGDDGQQPADAVVGRGARPHGPVARGPLRAPRRRPHARQPVDQVGSQLGRPTAPRRGRGRSARTNGRRPGWPPGGQHHRAVGPSLLDRVGPDVLDRPRRLIGIDQQPGDGRLLGAQLPRLQPDARMAMGGAGEGAVGEDLDGTGDAVDPEAATGRRGRGRGPRGTSGPAGSRGGGGRDPFARRPAPPPAAAAARVGEATGRRSTRPANRAVSRSSVGTSTSGGPAGSSLLAGRAVGGRRRRARRVGGARPPASTAPRWRPRGAPPGRRGGAPPARRGPARVPQVVVVGRDAVAVLAALPGQHRFEAQRDAQLPQVVLVPLERPPEAGRVLG